MAKLARLHADVASRRVAGIEDLLSALPQPALVVGGDGAVQAANAAAGALFARPAGELSGRSLADLIPEARGFAAGHRRLPRRGATARRSDGSALPVELATGALDGPDGPLTLVTVRDLTAERVAQRELGEGAAALERAEHRFRAVLEAAPDAIVGVGVDGRIGLVNPSAERMFGYEPGTMVGLSVDALVPAAARAAHARHRAGFARNPVARTMGAGMELVAVRRDGSEFPVQVSLGPMETDQGTVTTAMIVDITDRRRAEAELARRAAQQAAVAELGALALEGVQLPALIDRAAVAVAEGLGVELAKVLELRRDGGQLLMVGAHGWPEELVGQAVVPLEGSLAGHALRDEGPLLVDDLLAAADLSVSPLLQAQQVRASAMTAIAGPDGPWGVLAAHSRQAHSFSADDRAFMRGMANVLGEAIARSEAEARLRRQAAHDPLTGLANRAVLFTRLAARLADAGTPDEVAVVFVDLDGFKPVNDAFGHAYGDELLRKVARRLRATTSGLVARFGGDEFVAVVDEVEDRDDVLRLAARIIAAVTRPVTLHDATCNLSASVGIAFARPGRDRETADWLDATALVRRADTAMYRAKAAGAGRIAVFDEGMERALRRRIKIEHNLRRAEALDEWRVALQPVVRMADRAIVGFEALARWPQLQSGGSGAGEFVPVAEETGLIVPLGARILEQALVQAVRWPIARGAPKPHVAVNLSPRQIADRDVVPMVARALKRSGLPPGRLALEITETVLLDDSDTTRDALRGLRNLGVRLFLDDFGTGYSSLTHLRRYRIDALKIDRSFVCGLVDEPADQAIVTGIAAMASRLGIDVIAEGVETDAQAAALRVLGCRYGQGYLFSPAVCGGKAVALLPHPI
jgi:diguanylate cyclase (GGDEF)-like protein/PAS domain S-box-containing protein